MRSSTEPFRRQSLFTAAFALYWTAAERVLPHPIPFLQYGLSNIALLAALPQIPFAPWLAAAVLKWAAQGVFNGLLFSPLMLVSGVGTIAAALSMQFFYLLLKKKASLISVAVLSALVSNVLRLAVASLFFGTDAVAFIAVPFLLGGWAASAVTGWLAQKLLPICHWNEVPPIAARKATDEERKTARMGWAAAVRLAPFSATAIFYATNCRKATVAFFFLLVFCFLIFRKKNRWTATAATFLFIFIFALFQPQGRILADLGFFRLTAGAVENGLFRASAFCALILSSKIALSKNALSVFSRFPFVGDFFLYFEAFWVLPLDRKKLFVRAYPREIAAVLNEEKED